MTDQPKWTPGPWEIEQPQNFALQIVHGDFPTRHQDVAQIPLDQADEYDTPEQEARANARLIAAAPDMAEALESLLRYFEDLYGDNVLPDNTPTDLKATMGELRRARAALSKARGA